MFKSVEYIDNCIILKWNDKEREDYIVCCAFIYHLKDIPTKEQLLDVEEYQDEETGWAGGYDFKSLGLKIMLKDVMPSYWFEKNV